MKGFDLNKELKLKKALDLIEAKLSNNFTLVMNNDLVLDGSSDDQIDLLLKKLISLEYINARIKPHYGDCRPIILIEGITEKGKLFKEGNTYTKIKSIVLNNTFLTIVGLLIAIIALIVAP